VTFKGTGVSKGSLSDGIYQLTAHAAAVHGFSGVRMLRDKTTAFHCLRGDVDGNGTVNARDLKRASIAFGSTPIRGNYAWYLDSDRDGYIGTADIVQIRKRYGRVFVV
jgi:hypothetical protein